MDVAFLIYDYWVAVEVYVDCDTNTGVSTVFNLVLKSLHSEPTETQWVNSVHKLNGCAFEASGGLIITASGPVPPTCSKDL